MLIGEAMTVIEIDRSPAVGSRIDAQLQRPPWSLFGVLNQWLHWQDASSAHVDRHRIELRMHFARLREFGAGLRAGDVHNGWRGGRRRHLLAGPKIKPRTWWKRDDVVIHGLAEWLRRDH